MQNVWAARFSNRKKKIIIKIKITAEANLLSSKLQKLPVIRYIFCNKVNYFLTLCMNIIFPLIKKSINTKGFDNSDKVLIKHSCYLMEIFTDTAETFYN